MSENCNHDCSNCSQNCESRDMHEAPHAQSQIKKVIGVVSGKGGVGKSLVTGLLAVTLQRRGLQTGILDADISGPSVPKIIGGTVKQFWTDVIWAGEDVLFLDMPPGTGDVALTVFQTVALDGIIIVTSPQELVSMIVEKALKLAQLMNVPVLGLVENFSYALCPDCGKHIAVFGESRLESVAERYGLPILGRLPIDPKLAAACDAGTLELFEGDWLEYAADAIEAVEAVEK